MKIIKISTNKVIYLNEYPSRVFKVFYEEFNTLDFKVVSLDW